MTRGVAPALDLHSFSHRILCKPFSMIFPRITGRLFRHFHMKLHGLFFLALHTPVLGYLKSVSFISVFVSRAEVLCFSVWNWTVVSLWIPLSVAFFEETLLLVAVLLLEGFFEKGWKFETWNYFSLSPILGDKTQPSAISVFHFLHLSSMRVLINLHFLHQHSS